MNDINDAAEGTLQWIDTTDEYMQWQESEESRLLLLEGKAGSGKSVFTKTLWKTASQSIEKSKSKNAAVLSYFCNNRVRPQESCLEILRAFIYQYLRDDKSRFTEIYEKCNSLVDVWDPSQPDQFEFDMDKLLDVLATILNLPEQKTIYCIVDAIDECQNDENLEKFIGQLPSLLKPNANAAVKLFISSRPDWIADNNFLQLKPLKIVLRPEVTEKDIAQVVELELCRLETKLTISKNEKEALKKKLISKAEGMMLWVILAFRRIQERIKGMLAPTLKWLEKMVEKLPREIFSMYDHIMTSIRKKYGKVRARGSPEYTESSESEDEKECSNLAVYGKLVLWVARAGRPLTVTELQYALALDLKDTCFDEMKSRVNRDIERVIGRIPFLEIISADRADEDSNQYEDAHEDSWLPKQAMAPSSTVRFIHQSAKEYILRSAENSDKKDAEKDADFKYPKLDDACIGNLCVNFLSLKDFEAGAVRKFEDGVRFREGFKKYVNDYGFLEYCALFWAYHLNRAPNLPEAVKANVGKWICDRKNNLRLYAQVSNFVLFDECTDFIDGEFGILASAGAGIDWLTEYLIKEGHDIDARDDWGRTAYMLATWRGYAKTGKILADAGANTNCNFLIRCPGDRDDFHSKVLSVEIKYIQEAIDEGIEINERDYYFERTPIFYACARGEAEIVTLILAQNPDLSVKDKYGRLPIDVTLNSECRDLIIKKMREKKIKCTQEMVSKIPCVHPYNGEILGPPHCNVCGRNLWTFYYRKFLSPCRPHFYEIII